MDYSIQGGDVVLSSPVFLLFILLILLLQLRERKVRLWSMILVPALMLVVSAGVISFELSASPVAWLAVLGGFVMGATIGTLIASRMHLKIADDGSLVMRGSVLAICIWAVVIIVKVYGKDVLVGTGLVDLNLLTSALIAMTLGTMIFRRGYVYYRFTQLKKQQNLQ